MDISDRKKEHLQLALNPNMQYTKSTGLELVELIHNAMPELDFDEIDTTTTFFDKTFSYPIMILGMTGGHEESYKINIRLAKLAASYNIPFGVGSQRAMIEKPQLTYTYDVKKEVEDVFLIGNIGGVQLLEYDIETIKHMADKIRLDALAIHLNPMQEVVQPEGDKNFRGIYNAIKDLNRALDIPIIVKEVGAGISRNVAKRLSNIGIKFLDISGAGGTSWGKIEYARKGGNRLYGNWGIPTALAILMCKDIINVLASGGIRNGLDIAKSIVLGAKMAGMAQPFLKSVYQQKERQFMEEVIKDLKIAMLLTASPNIESLQKAPYYTIGWLNQVAKDMGLEYIRI